MAIEIKCSGKDYLPLGELTTFQGNLKTLSEENYKKLRKQIEQHGFIVPFFVWKSGDKNYILDGHQRETVLLRMRSEGVLIPDEYPVVFIEAENRKEAKAKLLAINSQYGTMTEEGLFDFVDNDFNFGDLSDFTLPVDMIKLEDMFGNGEEHSEEELDHIPEERKTDIKMGDMFQLGRHRLLCGDCTKQEDVDRLMDGEKADMVVTSPPYENQREYSQWPTYEDYNNFIEKVIKEIFICTKKISVVCWNIGSSESTNNFIPADHYFIFKKIGFRWIEYIVWNKESATWTIPRNQHIEKGMYIPALRWESIIIFDKGKRPYFEIKDKDKIREWQENVWNINKVIGAEQKKIGHTALFPVELPRRCILSYTLKEGIVYEPFCGGGTTLIACEETGRICRGMEIEPTYCQVIIDRWEKLTGLKAERI